MEKEDKNMSWTLVWQLVILGFFATLFLIVLIFAWKEK